MSDNNQYIAFQEGREVDVQLNDHPESQSQRYSVNEDFARRDRVKEILEEAKSGNAGAYGNSGSYSNSGSFGNSGSGNNSESFGTAVNPTYSFKVEQTEACGEASAATDSMSGELDSEAAFSNADCAPDFEYKSTEGRAADLNTDLNYERKTCGSGNGDGSGYVTKQFMIICMCIAIVVSTLLGAGISMMLGGAGSNKSHSNLSESSESAATGSKLTVGEIVSKNADAVVEIVVESESMGFFGEQQISEGAGSGVIVNESGYIVTNYHVIEGASSVQVTLHNGDSYKATIVGGDDASDMAVLKINAKDLKVVTIGDSSKVAVGDLAVAIGNPLGQLGGTATSGIISALDRRLTIEDRTLTLLQTDAAVNPGNSGGGLFNGRGELIGIVESKTSATGVEGLAFAIPINSITDEIDDLIDDGKVSAKPSIGISIYDISEQNAQYYNLDGEGVYIAEVSGDNAKKAGFKKMDKVISINGHEIDGSSDLISRVRECKVGDTVTVVVMRDGQKISIKTKLEESIASK